MRPNSKLPVSKCRFHRKTVILISGNSQVVTIGYRVLTSHHEALNARPNDPPAHSSTRLGRPCLTLSIARSVAESIERRGMLSLSFSGIDTRSPG